jgi:hypothetical protein
MIMLRAMLALAATAMAGQVATGIFDFRNRTD